MATRLAILVEVVPVTDTKPRRWKAPVEPHNAGGKRRSLICDDPIEGNQDPELLAAIALIQQLGWEISIPLHKGSISSSASVFVFENPQEV
jgi:hypothetical protein